MTLRLEHRLLKQRPDQSRLWLWLIGSPIRAIWVVFSRHRGAVRFGSRNDSDSVAGMAPWTRLCRMVYIVDRQPPCSLARLYGVQYYCGYNCMAYSTIALYGYEYDIRQMWGTHVHAPWLIAHDSHTLGLQPHPYPTLFLQPLYCTESITDYLFACRATF